MFRKSLESPTSIESKIFQTLNHYEVEVEILRQEVYTLEEKIKLITEQHELIQQNIPEPLDENELLYAKSNNFKDNKDRFKELIELIDDKIENEQQ